jgi:hypothetical protein
MVPEQNSVITRQAHHTPPHPRRRHPLTSGPRWLLVQSPLADSARAAECRRGTMILFPREVFMSRSKSRKCRRLRRLEEAVAWAMETDAVAASRPHVTPGDGELARLLRDIEGSGRRVWEVAEVLGTMTAEERAMIHAMIAQVVAPRLAGMAPKAPDPPANRTKGRPRHCGCCRK